MARKGNLRKLIVEHQRRLQKRKEEKARLGISTPPEVLNEIEDIEAEIQRLQGELESLGDDGGEESRAGAPPSQPPPEPGSGQVAKGSYIAQADRGGTATVSVNQPEE